MNHRKHYPVVQIVDGVRKFRQLHVLDQEMLVCTKLVKIEPGSQFHVKWYTQLSQVGDLHSHSFMSQDKNIFMYMKTSHKGSGIIYLHFQNIPSMNLYLFIKKMFVPLSTNSN